MRKLVLSIFIVFVLILHSPQLVLADNVPIGVKPEKVTAKSPELDILGKIQFELTFWNVGQLSDNTLYHEVILTGICIDQSSDGWECVADEEENAQKGTFSGGPNGTFTFPDNQFSLKDGKTATVFSEGVEIVFTVQNTDAFNGWDDQIFDEKTALDPGASDRPEGMLETSDVTITNIIGEVGVSDPSVRRGLFDQTIKAFKTLTGWDKDPEPWRVRVDARNGMNLKNGFQMKTGEGRAVIQFKDGTKFIMKENSTMTFNHLGFNLDTGTTIYNFHKVGKKIYITDKRGKFSIVGTQFEITTGEDNTQLKVYEGSVETENLNGKDKTIVKAGEQIIITNNGLEDKSAISGEQTIDTEAIEREIIASEKIQAGKFILIPFGIIVIGAVCILGIILLFKRRK
ncbi:FecR domain-containing protein [Candidatus Dojkabacteria bacterium]|nr:FecR domain-containing protein [Candidatus Dojkabacteria bacterium]